MHASATMGRLRTAVRTSPTSTCRRTNCSPTSTTWSDASTGARAGTVGAPRPTRHLGATCLYAVYDPVSRRCTLARAGHPPPAVVAPGRHGRVVDLPAGPPLGLGGLPFETIELELPEGSLLALYTDGLVEDRRPRHRRRRWTGCARASWPSPAGPWRTPARRCSTPCCPPAPSDDVALLLARTRALGADRVAPGTCPPIRRSSSGARTDGHRQLHAWGLDDAAFATELVVSELVTNAIRYATGPIQLRLIRDRDPHLRGLRRQQHLPAPAPRPHDDEGGRGLFLVAQLTQRWGTRYTPDGKTIWAEQPLP